MENKYKICIYAICKNEEKFVERWVENAREADKIIVTDTGSSDGTVNKLKSLGVEVHELEINPFRFDQSRNYCMQFIPENYDICISLDLDEVIQPGWRKHIEAAWKPESTLGRYLFNWALNDKDEGLVQYYYDRIHSRHGYRWVYPTHEVLKYIGSGNEIRTFIPGLTVNHYPDRKKNRSFNLPLLELAVTENPGDARNMHYLGREYMYAGQWQNCISILKKYLSPKISHWDEERSASMRFIARACGGLGDKAEQKRWLYRAAAEAPNLREPYIELAFKAYDEADWPALYYFSREALKIKAKTFGYANEIFAWDSTPYDLAAIGAYRLGLIKEACGCSEEALKLSPDDERLIKNNEIYLEELKK